MDKLKQHVIEELQNARQSLLSISKNALTSVSLDKWHNDWHRSFLKAEGSSGRSVNSSIIHLLRGYDMLNDTDILLDLRANVVAYLDEIMALLDSQIVVRSVLEEYILRVQEIKLAALLKEFNAAKDTSPNLAAIGFRTILSLIIQEKAKLVSPQTPLVTQLATQQDLVPDRDLTNAITARIFSPAEAKHLDRFQNGGRKVTFDNITHKPGATYLVNKADLEDAVDLLNSLLPTIIP